MHDEYNIRPNFHFCYSGKVYPCAFFESEYKSYMTANANDLNLLFLSSNFAHCLTKLAGSLGGNSQALDEYLVHFFKNRYLFS